MWQSERCRSEAQKGKKDLCDLIFWVWQTFSVQILCWRGQGDKVSTDSLDTQYCWVCSPAIPKTWHSSVSTSVEGALLKGSKDTSAPVLLPLTWPVTAHNPKDTDPRNSPQLSHFMHVQLHASRMPLWWAGIQLLHHLKHWNGKKICIHYRGRSHTECGHKPVRSVFGIRNFFLTLLYSTARVCPQCLIAVLGGLIYYDNCSVFSLYFKFSKTECIFPSCGWKCCAVIQWKHN